MESSIAVFLLRHPAFEQLPTLAVFQTSHLAGAPHKYGFAREIQRTRLANTTQYVVTLLRCCRLDLLLLHSCGATAPPVTLSGCALFANINLPG